MTPYYQDSRVTIFCGDCLEILPGLSPVNLTVTDPPYVFGLGSTAKEGKVGTWGDMMNAARWYASWIRLCKRLTESRQGAAWIFNSWRSSPILYRAALLAEWQVLSQLIWDKQWIGPGGVRGLRPSYEIVTLLAHPEFQLSDRSLSDIWQAQWASARPSGHAAEKPVSLLSRIIKESGGGVILDPFMGSGSTLVAAVAQGCEAVGIETEEKWCEVAVRRVAQVALML